MNHFSPFLRHLVCLSSLLLVGVGSIFSQETVCPPDVAVVTPCYVAGDPLGGGLAGIDPVLVSVPFDVADGSGPFINTKKVLARGEEVGAVWGVAYHSQTQTVYSSTVLKRHTGWGPLGLGGIYAVDAVNGGVIEAASFSLEDLGIEVGGSEITAAARNLPADPVQDRPDVQAFRLAGKVGLGDLDFDELEENLYVVNLFDKSIYAIAIDGIDAAPAASDVTRIALPGTSCSPNVGELVPWGLKVKEGKVFVGAVCTAGISQNPDDLTAYVLAYTLETGTWETVIEFSLNFPRGVLTLFDQTAADWNPWITSWEEITSFQEQLDLPIELEFYEGGHPQPILSDIEFDDEGSLIMGFIDRGGLQLGYKAVSTLPNDDNSLGEPRLYIGTSGGDLLKACFQNGTYVLEDNGTVNCGSPRSGTGVGNDQGPGGGEFFGEDAFVTDIDDGTRGEFHQEITLGGILYKPGTNTLITSAYDPINDEAFSGGLIWYNTVDGTKEKGVIIFQNDDEDGSTTGFFGKAAGLGDVEILCTLVLPDTCEAFAGTLSSEPLDEGACVEPGQADAALTLTASEGEAARVPEGYLQIFVLTQGEDLVILETSESPSFTVQDTGTYTIHSLVYNPDASSDDFLDLGIIVPGETTGAQVLELINTNEICASLDVAGARFEVPECPCEADLAGVTAFPTTPECKDEELFLGAELQGNSSIPEGSSLVYVLTFSDDLVVLAVDTAASFVAPQAGNYRIHPLIVPTDLIPTLIQLLSGGSLVTATDAIALLDEQGICYALDVEGALFEISQEQIDACLPDTCTADAGTLSGIELSPEDCLDPADSAASVTLVATPNGDAVVPEGYATLFVLTRGSELLITGVSETPEFTVSEAGLYTIHTLVYSADSASEDFLDLSVVVPGETTGAQVLELINTNEICASLDVSGAAFEVETCGTCTADAGTLSGIELSPEDCLDPADSAASVTLVAKPNGDAVVPEGYATLFVLTRGSELLITGVSETPEFTVSEAGLYTIHTLVYSADSASEDFLDLSVVVPGETTGAQVLELISANEICASLDVSGAAFEVETCGTCTADAGTLSGIELSPEDCLDPADSAASVTLVATPNGDAVVPEGYATLFVLTRGSELLITGVSETPEFTVSEAGLYTIHTLVYSADSASEDFLDLSVVVPGETTGAQVLELISANEICASLDVSGAAFEVIDCQEEECVEVCVLADWKDEGVADIDPPFNHALFLMTSPADPENALGINTHEQRFVWVDQGVWTNYGDSATITGTVVNKVDTSMLIDIHFILTGPMSWEEWSGMGGTYMADNSTTPEVVEANYESWTYWTISSESKLTGAGSLEGVSFTIEQFPLDKALQVGVGANDKDGSLGLSCWFNYEGEYKGMTLAGMGDLNLDIVSCDTVCTVSPADKVAPMFPEPASSLRKLEQRVMSQVIYEVYPVPGNAFLNVHTETPERIGNYLFQLSDLSGHTVYESRVEHFEGDTQLDIRHLASGIYTLQIIEPGGKQVLKRISVIR